jgi:DNA-directed RNA polymerase specialized sigma24 family protein
MQVPRTTQAFFAVVSALSTPDEGSVTHWLGDLRSGGDAAAQRLWERYFERLVNVARERLRRPGVAEDAEDAALSAFDSFCRGVEQGRFPRLDHRDDLWRLLVVITVRKALDQIERQRAAKRGGGRLIGEGGLEAGLTLDHFAGREPSPELAVLVADQYKCLRARLGDDSLRLVLDLSLEGYRREEIAARMGRTLKTVTRKLEVIRKVWLEKEDEGP